MKTIIAAFTLFALTATVEAKTVVISGTYKADRVQSMCKAYGGTFSQSAKGHGCRRSGYGTVWCSKAGKCVANVTDKVRLASR